MSNLPSSENGESSELALIAEGTPGETKISLQVLQNIYHELTGKTEDLSKSWDDPLNVELNDFQQLNYWVTQCLEQYNIKAINCSIKTFYLNDTKETFSSFDRFLSFNFGSTSPVENILITYNFLVILPKLEKPQSYTLSVRMLSRIAIEHQMRKSMPFRLPKILRTMGNKTAIVEIKYIDYAVARNLLSTLDQWFAGIKRSKTNPVLAFLSKNSQTFPYITKYCAGLFATYFAVSKASIFLSEHASPQQQATYLILAFVGIFAAYRMAEHLGSAAEDSLDSWTPLSYVSITVGDKNLISEAQTENRRNVIGAFWKFTSGLSISIFTKLLISFLSR
jgi:hypothetical protein